MKKPLLAILLISFFISLSSAGSVCAQEKEQNIRNSNALYFYLINGYAVSYKFKSEGNSSYRLRLDLATGYSDGDGTEDYHYYSSYDTTFNSYSDKQNSSQISISISPQYFYNVYETDLAKIYLGFGPYIAYSIVKNNSDSKRIIDSEEAVSYSSEDTRKSYSLGLSAIFGIEGYITKNISVFAETQLNGGRSWNDYKNLTTNDNNSGRNEAKNYNKSWSISLTNIRIGLGIYF